MKTFTLITGNITFHHFTVDELAAFKTDKENKALIHSVTDVNTYSNLEDAYKVADEAESYIIIGAFTGEMVFENPTDEFRFNTYFECMRTLEKLTGGLCKHKELHLAKRSV